MINILIVGYGNVGKKAVNAILKERDLKLVGIKDLFKQNINEINVPFVTSIEEIKEKIDVAILCVPSLKMIDIGIDFLNKKINVVDSFDIHADILKNKKKLDLIAKKNKKVYILSAGWDPGSDSVIRALVKTMAPNGITYTNFGPGMSMGHTVIVKSIEGVQNAISLTIPVGAGIHRRMVYVQLKKNINFKEVVKKIKNNIYFIKDETYVEEVENINEILTSSHSVKIEHIGISSDVNNQRIDFKMKIDNPALTAQIMVSCARAAMRQTSGCLTMIEIPPVDYLPKEKEYWIKKLV